MALQVCLSFAQNICSLASQYQQEYRLVTDIFYDDLPKRIQNQQLRAVPAVLVLADSDYQLLVAKKPDVPTGKIKEALLWQEQARFLLPLDQIVLEYFECRLLNGEQKLFLVAVAKQQLQTRFQQASDAGLKVTRITIPELIYTSYVQKKLPHQDCVIWINLFPEQSKLLFIVNNDLVTTLRLPKMITDNASTSADQQSISQALKLFYHEQLLALQKLATDFDESRIKWVINSPDLPSAKKLAEVLPGHTEFVNFTEHFTASKNNHKEVNISLSHAAYGVLVES